MLIAQITDTHIKARPKLAYRRVDTALALERCVRHVNSLSPAPDVAVLTGDLVDAAMAAEYADLRDLLASLAVPFYLIPGNHDSRDAMRAAFPEHRYLLECGEFVQYVVDEYPVRVIGLDSTIPGSPGGRMCERRLQWLDAKLTAAPDRATLLFIHHPPFMTGIEHMDVQCCDNAEAFAAVVARHPQVVRLLCGHVHRAIYVAWAGTIASIGPSPSHAVALDLTAGGPSAFVMEPPAIALHYWRQDTGLVTHLSFIQRYDGPYPFFDGGGKLID